MSTNVYRIDGHQIVPVPFQVFLFHSSDDCDTDTPCVVHSPTEHPMRTWPLHWRNDRSIFERICDHAIGHPDPDQFAHFREYEGDEAAVTAGVHGCDGCCAEGST